MQFAISIKVKQHHELPNPILVLASIKQCWVIIRAILKIHIIYIF